MPTAPFDLLSVALKAAEVRLKGRIDTLQAIGGRVLENTQAFSQQGVNNAWRRLQEDASRRGSTLFTDTAIVTALPIVTKIDPSSSVSLSWAGYFDGTTVQSAPYLPADLVQPLVVQERWNGTGMTFRLPMEQMADGLPAWNKRMLNCRWEWRNSAIWMPGALQLTDLRIRYRKRFVDFADAAAVRWFQQPIPVVNVTDQLSLYICMEFAPSVDSRTMYEDLALSSLANLMSREVDALQRVNVKRQPCGGGSRRRSWCH